MKVKERRGDCFPKREVVEAQLCVATPIPIATSAQTEMIVSGCAGRDAFAGGSFATTAAGTWDVIYTMSSPVSDKTTWNVG